MSVLGGSVSGHGPIGPLTVGPQGRIYPGAGGHGTLTTGDLSLAAATSMTDGSTLAINLFAGGDSTSLNVHGTVQLAGELTTEVIFPLRPAIGTRWRIITNDGADAVQGMFQSLREGAIVRQIYGTDLRITYHGGDGNDVDLVTARSAVRFAVAAGPGAVPTVNWYDGSSTLIRSINAYDLGFRGGVRVAIADLTGDGTPDVVTAPGSGTGPDVRVFDGNTGALAREFFAYDSRFFGGVFVAIGDVNGDGTPDIVTGAGAGGGPHVKVFNGATGTLIRSFLAYDAAFRGGVTVAAGDVNGDGHADIITGAGPGGGPHVRVFDGATGAPIASFFAYDLAFTGGVYVAAGDLNRDNKAEIITGTGPGGGPLVRVFNGQTGAPLASFFAYNSNFRGGVTVGAVDLDDDGIAEILTGAGPGGGPHVRRWLVLLAPSALPPGPFILTEFFAFDPAFTGGVFVG